MTETLHEKTRIDVMGNPEGKSENPTTITRETYLALNG